MTLEDHGISIQQLNQDREALYGIIVTLTRYEFALEITSKHAETSDGILAYSDLVTKYGGSIEVRKMIAKQTIDTSYSVSYPGGLTTFLKKFEQAIILHDQLELEQAKDQKRTPTISCQSSRFEIL